MKIRIIYTTAFILLLCLTNVKMQAQITRGAIFNEIYIATDWYVGNGVPHYAVIHSTNNGENISIQYENIVTVPPGEMKVGKVIGDATPGVLYNYGWNKLWVSFDYGQSWEYREDYTYASYTTGFDNGEIYRRSNYNLYRSINYGTTFELIVESLPEPLSDVGVSPGELFGITGTAGIGYNLYHSTNYGNNFSTIPLDSTVAFWQVSGKYPEISRGTEPGELYLVSWWPESFFRIFHSVDTGYSWTQQYSSDYINLYYWGVQYTAGSKPGSFYVKRSRLNETFDHSLLYIDYSSDYGETFTTYFHDLDSTYTSVGQLGVADINIMVSPNPFTDKATFEFNLPTNTKKQLLNIYNVNGELVKQYEITKKSRQQWDGRDNNGILVPNGIYMFNIKNGSFTSQFHKLLFIH